VEICIRLWFEEKEKVLFGDGRLQLLQAVESAGSLAAAARELNMSYRAAWGRLHASEDRLGFTLVERGSEGRRAMVLTPVARELMTQYAKLRDLAQSQVDKHQKEVEKLIKSARRKKKK
jgi:molybdate transport system regulatory protein